MNKRGEIKLGKSIDPLFHEFHLKDVLQVLLGASILSIPVGFTEEFWRLGEILPIINILGFVFLSFLFISLFTYYHYHKEHGLRKHHKHFVKRVVLTYLLSFAVVTLLMALIQKAPIDSDFLLAFKRIALVTFPASISGTIADVVK